jgi:hypothetical protein
MPRPAFIVAGVVALTAGLLALDPNVLTAVATAVLTGFAALQIRSERAKRRSEERTANARLSVNAFATRQRLAEWVRWARENGLNDVAGSRAGEAISFALGIRAKLEEGLIDASAASPAAAESMRTAYAYCQRAWLQFESYQTRHRQLQGATTPADSTLLTDGVESFHGCYLALEGVVEPALVAEAKRLGGWSSV